MTLFKKNSLIIILILAQAPIALADTYFIDRDRSNIFNHANPNTEGSIAWHFKTYGENNRYVLSSPATDGSYAITEPLRLPKGSTLESSNAGQSWVRAYGAIPWMIQVFDSSKISGVVLDGNYLATQVVHGSYVTNFELEGSILRRTVNFNPPSIVNNSDRIRAHIVVLNHSNNLQIRNNVIENAGDRGFDLENNDQIEATGLFLTGGNQITITGNTIRYTLSAGINTTNSKYVTITDNTIDNIGRANVYGNPYPADGITGYHNDKFDPSENLYYTVTGNVITNWHNHGIHLSGRWINISNNRVISPGIIPAEIRAIGRTTGHAIFVGDFRPRVRCSSIIWIQKNHIERSTLHPTDNADGIRLAHYKHAAYWPHANTGDVGNSVSVTDHRYQNLAPAGQSSCHIGFADQYY